MPTPAGLQRSGLHATIYRKTGTTPSELARRPSQLPSRSGWSVYGDLPRSPIRGIRNFATAEQAAEQIDQMFRRYRDRMEREGISAQDLKAEITAARREEDDKYLSQVSYENSRNGRHRPNRRHEHAGRKAAVTAPAGHHGLQLGLLS